jgi:hypothetical protein
MRITKIDAPAFLRRIPVLLPAAALLIMAAAGCGSGGDTSPPVISGAVITTSPNPLTYLGGTATVTANVTDSTGVNAATVKADVLDQNAVSLTGGPQTMAPSLTVPGQYSYTVTLPNNLAGTTNKVYTVSITAADTIGNATPAPFAAGTITVPFPPAPPSGP